MVTYSKTSFTRPSVTREPTITRDIAVAPAFSPLFVTKFYINISNFGNLITRGTQFKGTDYIGNVFAPSPAHHCLNILKLN